MNAAVPMVWKVSAAAQPPDLRRWASLYEAGPQIDDWNRLDPFACDFRRAIGAPFAQVVPNGEEWSVATDGRLLVAFRCRVKWIESAAPGGVSLRQVWASLDAVSSAQAWQPLAEIPLPSREWVYADEYWTLHEDHSGEGSPEGERPLSYEEALEVFGQDAADAWAPFAACKRVPICGRDFNAAYLRRLLAYFPDARIALGQPVESESHQLAPLSGDFMGGLGRWLCMPMRRE